MLLAFSEPAEVMESNETELHLGKVCYCNLIIEGDSINAIA